MPFEPIDEDCDKIKMDKKCDECIMMVECYEANN